MTESGIIKPSVGVGCVVYDHEGRILLVRRAKPPQAGFWHFPGGRLEPGESLVECCQREVWEETGLKVTPLSIVAIADRFIEGFHYVIIDFLARLSQPEATEPHPDSDAADARWFHVGELDEKPLVTGLLEIIEASRERSSDSRQTGLVASHHPWLFTPQAQAGDQTSIPPEFSAILAD